MVRPALLPLGLGVLLVLAGCNTGIPGTNTTPADIEPGVVGRIDSGGTCVENPTRGIAVDGAVRDGIRIVVVEGNVTVPGAHYEIDETTLTRTGETSYRLDVNTTISDEKPAMGCADGGIVPYEVRLEVPGTDSFDLQILHNGEPVSGVGSGAET